MHVMAIVIVWSETTYYKKKKHSPSVNNNIIEHGFNDHATLTATFTIKINHFLLDINHLMLTIYVPYSPNSILITTIVPKFDHDERFYLSELGAELGRSNW